jgi:hypothetical protein
MQNTQQGRSPVIRMKAEMMEMQTGLVACQWICAKCSGLRRTRNAACSACNPAAPVVTASPHAAWNVQCAPTASGCTACNCAQQACSQTCARSSELGRQSRCMPHACCTPLTGYKPLADKLYITDNNNLQRKLRLTESVRQLSSFRLISKHKNPLTNPSNGYLQFAAPQAAHAWCTLQPMLRSPSMVPGSHSAMTRGVPKTKLIHDCECHRPHRMGEKIEHTPIGKPERQSNVPHRTHAPTIALHGSPIPPPTHMTWTQPSPHPQT